jgi:hypothetical protein
MKIFEKDADAVLDYLFDWSDWLGSDTISTITITADTGITVASSSNTTTNATVWLSGGTAGTIYRLACKIVTVAGRTDERTVGIKVVHK